ncbi:hypothetical protein CYMTET_2659 [Cymbomonas tetramitiformis]|uniref:Uncharacterized protein n=1 Tax=Cymbomonas tetramitiformis TaxID=36881 RepID=A0AAE0H4M9_9CHLO|nr:hypothetical protein CYMTET_2659 [Cymbomonas tetramitiformis]|eukprot:gene2605-3362_t
MRPDENANASSSLTDLQDQIERRQVINQLQCRVHVQLYFDVLQSLSIFVTGMLYSVDGFLYYAAMYHLIALFGMLVVYLLEFKAILITVALVGSTLGLDMWCVAAATFSLYSCLHVNQEYGKAHVLWAAEPCGAHRLDSGLVFALVAAMTAYGILGSVVFIQNLLQLNKDSVTPRKTYYAVVSYTVIVVLVLLRIFQHFEMLAKNTTAFFLTWYIFLWSIVVEIIFTGLAVTLLVVGGYWFRSLSWVCRIGAIAQYIAFVLDILNAALGVAMLRAPQNDDEGYSQTVAYYFGRSQLREYHMGEMVLFVTLSSAAVIPHFVLASSLMDKSIFEASDDFTTSDARPRINHPTAILLKKPTKYKL